MLLLLKFTILFLDVLLWAKRIHGDVIRKCNKPGKVISEQESKKEKVQMKVEKIPTSQKAKSDPAQGVQVTI